MMEFMSIFLFLIEAGLSMCEMNKFQKRYLKNYFSIDRRKNFILITYGKLHISVLVRKITIFSNFECQGKVYKAKNCMNIYSERIKSIILRE